MIVETQPSIAAFASLPNRGLLRLSGEDRAKFLQGLVSNDVTHVGPDRAVYACLLTPQGKFLHDFFLIADGDSLLIECEPARSEDLARRLKAFRLRSKVEIADISGEFDAFAVFGDPAAALLVSGAGEGESRRFAGGIAYDDPRLAALGSRVLLPKAVGDAPLAAAGFATAPFAAYDRLRIVQGVPDGSRDMAVEKAILLENNIDFLNGISWDKGCYMGQELTARTRYRGLIKKRLVPVDIAGSPPTPGTVLTEDGREIGEMRSGVGELGLALLRLDSIRAGRPLAVEGATLTPRPPAYLAAALAETADAHG